MGNYSTVPNGYITFKDANSMADAWDLVNGWVERANSMSLAADRSEGLNGEYNITVKHHLYDDTIEFEASSYRFSNLEWQMEQFLEFAKTLKGVAGFEADVLVSRLVSRRRLSVALSTH